MSKILIICGHYGSGKTNLTLNLAMSAKESATVCDLDIVNPYFRSGEFGEIFSGRNIKLITTKYANTTLDIPSVNEEVYGIFEREGEIFLDVGGDDKGATVLGRFSKLLNDAGAKMIYVVNFYRNLTRTAEEAFDVLKEIEIASRIKFQGIVNNSNLGAETTIETVENSKEEAERLSSLTGLPILFTTIDEKLSTDSKYRPIKIYVKPNFA